MVGSCWDFESLMRQPLAAIRLSPTSVGPSAEAADHTAAAVENPAPASRKQPENSRKSDHSPEGVVPISWSRTFL